MPYIHVKTNVAADDAAKQTIKSQLGEAISLIPGKSERWLMVEIDDGRALWFGGSDAPTALAEVKIFGSPDSGACAKLTAAITDILHSALGIQTDRIYVKEEGCSNWGVGGSNF